MSHRHIESNQTAMVSVSKSSECGYSDLSCTTSASAGINRVTQIALDRLSDAVFWVNGSGRIVYVNDAACRLIGQDSEGLLAISIEDICKDQDHVKSLRPKTDVNGMAEKACRAEFTAKSGQSIPVDITSCGFEMNGEVISCVFARGVGNRLGSADSGSVDTFVADSRDKTAELQSPEDEIERRVQERTAQLTEELLGRERIETALLDETEKIQSILDNAGQGFLTFGESLKVDVEYSEECRKLFGGEVWGTGFPRLVYPKNERNREFLTSLLKDIFAENDSDRRGMFLSLLPSEVQVGRGFVRIEFKLITTSDHFRDRKMLVVMTDVTEQRRLSDQVEEERNLLKMVVKAVTNYGELAASVKNWDDFCRSGLTSMLEGSVDPSETRADVYRTIHTFKGSFDQLDMINSVRLLHDLETRISEQGRDPSKTTLWSLRYLLDCSQLETFLDKDMAVLKAILGEEFFGRSELQMVDPAQIVAIENEVLELLSPAEARRLVPRLRQLRYRPFRSLLESYRDYVANLAERLNKPVGPLAIEGGDSLVDSTQYIAFTRSLVHVFRNMIDHGIESEELRVSANKPEAGAISCRIGQSGGRLVLEIADDGYGINVTKLREKALEMGLFDSESAARATESEIMALVFRDRVTTNECVSDYSGRGIGLSAVKRELDRIGGTVQLESSQGEGTKFIFTLPVQKPPELPDLTVADIMNPLLFEAMRFMVEEMGVTEADSSIEKPQKSDQMSLSSATAMIGLKGIFRGVFLLSFDEMLTRKLVRRFSAEELSEEEVNEYLEDSIAEIANIILGRAIDAFPQGSDLLTIEPPATIRTARAVVKYTGTDIWTGSVHTNSGTFKVGFVSTDRVLS